MKARAEQREAQAVRGIHRLGRRLATRSSQSHFEFEQLVKRDGATYRLFDPRRSKLAAAIVKGLQQTGITAESRVLYLGASHGYTPSFIADIATQGWLVCLDISPRVVRDLVHVCEARENMAPLLADASQPSYAERIGEVDVVYQDIAQRDQLGIFLKNCDAMLAKGGYGLLALKARSMDVTGRPKELFKRVRKEFEHGEASKRYVIIDYRELEPFEKDHAFFVVKKR